MFTTNNANMKRILTALPKQAISRKELKELKGGAVLAGYRYICFEGYLCFNDLARCNLRCQRLSGQDCANWNAPCP